MILKSINTMEGCDISQYQGTVNFCKMKSKCGFVIIRAGYGCYTVDKKFKTYIESAIAAGLEVGVYWFMYAKTTYQAKLNAQTFLTTIEPYKNKVTCGLWCDWEYDSDKKAQVNTQTRNQIIQTFLEDVKAAGYEVGIYANYDYIKNNKIYKTLIAQYPLWYADYNPPLDSQARLGFGGYPYFTQNSSSKPGSDYGVSSKTVDVDTAYIVTQEKEITIYRNPFTYPQETVKYGSKNKESVKWVQWYLWRFGLISKENIDGIFGNQTEQCVKIAQQRLGLTVDGIVGENTKKTWLKLA